MAVLLVVGDHLLKWPTGGYVGVDVFFVISGFLITGLLLREHERSGRISFVTFYKRRIKRILPGAMLVIVASVAASWLLFSASRAESVTANAFWATFFMSNWDFAIGGTDYMNAGGPVSPLQHFWSLSVEEQFYFVWPVLIVGVLGAAKLGRGNGKRRLTLALSAIVIASFTWANVETATNPTWAYFSTATRVWELGAGALLALGATRLETIPNRARPVLAWLGIAAIGVSALALDENSAFPGPWALLPVLGAAAVIAAGSGGRQLYIFPLTNRVSSYVGDLSYSLYLWHFPVIVFCSSIFIAGGKKHVLVSGVLMFAAAMLSYHLVEDPVRRSRWLSSGKSSAASSLGNRTKLAVAGMLVISIGASAAAYATPGGHIGDDLVVASDQYEAVSTGPASDELAAMVSAALQKSAWPALDPGLDDLGKASKSPEWVVDGCLALDPAADPDPYVNAKGCVYGAPNSNLTAAVLGDSTAISYLPGIRAALEPLGYKILVYTMIECPAISLSVLTRAGVAHTQCDPFRDWAVGEIQKAHADLVFLTTSPESVDRLTGDPALSEAPQLWAEATGRTLKSLEGIDRVVVLDPPPVGRNLNDCATRLSKPSECASLVTPQFSALRAATEDAIDASPARTHVLYPQVRDWTCSTAGACPSFVGSTPVTADGLHLTANFAKLIGPVIAETSLADLQAPPSR